MNKVDYFGRSALHVASRTKHSLKIIQYLASQPINLDQLDGSGRSSLFIALKHGSEDVVHHLYDKGATAIAPKESWAKMLCTVGFNGDLQKLKLLKMCEVELEQSDYDLRHVGHLAACEAHYEMLEFLAKETTFSFELEDRWGNTTFDEMKHSFNKTQREQLKREYFAIRQNKK